MTGNLKQSVLRSHKSQPGKLTTTDTDLWQNSKKVLNFLCLLCHNGMNSKKQSLKHFTI